MSFARPELFWLAWTLPLFLTAAVYGYLRRRRRVAAALGDAELLHRLGGPGLERFPLRRAMLLAGAAAAIGLAATGPQWGVRMVEGQVTGRDVVLVLDVSRSMLVTDVTPNRLERQRLLARQLVRELEGSRIGLVAFAGRAYILSPLTVDRGALELYLDAIDPEIVSEGGSSMAAGIRQGTDLAGQGREGRGGQRTVILVSDGEAHEDEEAVLAAAARARRAGVAIHTVTVGTPAGGPVPMMDGQGRVTGYVRYEDQLVISRSDPELMRRVANETGGRALQLQAGAAGELAAAVRGAGAAEASGDRRYEPSDRFRWFAGAAAFLLALDVLLTRPATRPRPPARQEA